MEKINLSHNTGDLREAFGVSEERFLEMQKAVGHGVVESLTTEKKSETFQYIYDLVKPVNERELFLIGILIGLQEGIKEHMDMHVRPSRGKHPLSDILKKEGKVHES